MHFGILRSAAFYPVKTQIKLIMAYFLLHNFIRSMMPVDPIKEMMDTELANEDLNGGEQFEVELIDNIESSPEWNLFREDFSISMFNRNETRA
ncbi:hypothetical protein ACS0TY_019672 [Phlomoides rotata]